MFSRLGRWLWMFLLISALLTIAALIAGVFYERAQRESFRRGMPSPGVAVDIGGRSMNLYCTGEGNPPVIFEPGYEWPGMSWAAVQSKISPFTRACWYDRAGTGWSDPAPFPRTDEAVAQDLHALLVAAAIPPPYLLVGPRFGGHSMFVFHTLYPEQVAGMVLIDGQVDDTAPLPPAFLLYPLNVAAQVFARSGLLRLLDPPVSTRQLPSDLSAKQRATILTLKRQPEARAAGWSSELMRGNGEDPPAGSLGDLPLVVLTPDSSETPAKLIAASSRGRLVPVVSGKQDIAFEAPLAVAGAVAELVEHVRHPVTPPAPTVGPPLPPKSRASASASRRRPPPSRTRPGR